METLSEWIETITERTHGDFGYGKYAGGYIVITNRGVEFVPKGKNVVEVLKKIRSERPEEVPRLISVKALKRYKIRI